MPETVAIETAHVAEAVAAIEAGPEYTRSLLQEHDRSLGRTTRKNQAWAETMEADLLKMESAAVNLRAAVPVVDRNTT